MKGIVVVGHGSRSLDATKDFNSIIMMLKNKLSNEIILGAHMELTNPSLEESVEKLILENLQIKEIKIIPYFLYTGIHIKEDIPEIIDKLKIKYPKIKFKFGRALGVDPLIVEVLAKRVEEI